MKFNGREIDIYSAPLSYGVAHFYTNDNGLAHSVLCEVCEYKYLSPTYLYIMNILKEANLLPEDYQLLCCKCYNKIYPEQANKEWQQIHGEVFG